MSSSTTTTKLFMVSVTVLPQSEGVDLPSFIQKLANLLADYSSATRVLYKFKVTGEPRIISVISVSNVIGLERTLGGLSRLGAVEVECVPIINYEKFARRLGVADEMTVPNPSTLSKDDVCWLQFNIEHPDKSTDEMLAVWKKEAEAALGARLQKIIQSEIFKCVAQRTIHVIFNAPDPDQVDMMSFALPLMAENGAHTKVTCKALQFLDDYVDRITSETL